MTQQVQQLLSRLAGVSASLGVGAWVLSESLYNVDGGHAAIIWNRFGGGVQQYVMGEGSHFSALCPHSSGCARACGCPLRLLPSARAVAAPRRSAPRAPISPQPPFARRPSPPSPLPRSAPRRDPPGDLPHHF